MQSLADQLVKIIRRKSENLDLVAEVVAKEIGDQMDLNAQSGKSFANQEYNNTYSADYAKRVKGGQLSPVTIRDKNKRIEQRVVGRDKAKKKATVFFQDQEFSIILRYHHEGTAKGGKMRSLFPKSANAVPKDIQLKALKGVQEALTGV